MKRCSDGATQLGQHINIPYAHTVRSGFRRKRAVEEPRDCRNVCLRGDCPYPDEGDGIKKTKKSKQKKKTANTYFSSLRQRNDRVTTVLTVIQTRSRGRRFRFRVVILAESRTAPSQRIASRAQRVQRRTS